MTSSISVDRALCQSLASCINVLRPDPEQIELWIGALTSGDYKFAPGLLRSADDEYDAIGVLAALNAPAWEWNEGEDAWAIDGDAYVLKHDRLCAMLNIKETRSNEPFLNLFQDNLSKACDGAASFEEIATLLREALLASKMAHRRTDFLRADGRRYINPDGMPEDYTTLVADSTFYGRRW